MSVRSSVPITVNATLQVGTTSTEISVTGSDLVESDSSFHTDLDRDSSTNFRWRASLLRSARW